jgi:hypothetical protein
VRSTFSRYGGCPVDRREPTFTNKSRYLSLTCPLRGPLDLFRRLRKRKKEWRRLHLERFGEKSDELSEDRD